MRWFSIFTLLVVAACPFAQNKKEIDALIAYHAYRQRTTEPTFGLAKVKTLVSASKTNAGFVKKSLPPKEFAQLSLEEQFTYNMLYPQAWSQNCAGVGMETHEADRIYARPPVEFDATYFWSEGQIKWFRQNRSKVIGYLRQTIAARHDAGANVKQAIVTLQGYELIPDLVALFEKTPKDKDLLSTLGTLMNNGKYRPFQKSDIGQKLYSDKAEARKPLPATKQNEQAILDQAKAYFAFKMKH